MDPLTALGLAGNIISIVDVSAKLINTTWQVSRRGAKVEYIELEDQTKLVQIQLARLKPGLKAGEAGLSQDDQELLQLCEQSRDISEQLMKMLESCKGQGGAGKISLDAFLHAVRSEWKEDAVKDLKDRLETIETKVYRLLNFQYQTKIFEKMFILEQKFQALGTSRAEEFQGIEKAIRDLGKSDFEHGMSRSQLMLQAADKGGFAEDFAIQASILEQLRFEEIDRRLQELERRPSHSKSYLWLGGSNTGEKKIARDPSNFETWLTSPEKLYWVSGVPGSGKSTLMKYMYSNPKTKELLVGWTGGKKLLFAAYFFWEVGKIAMMRTQEGLLRTLLFQILRQCPELIADVYADLWTLFRDSAPTSQDSLSRFAGSRVSLSVPHLLQKMKECCLCIADRGYCLFLVIDGLDEYDGKPGDIIQLMSALTDLPSVKVCISSRPDNAFTDAYGGEVTKLFMEKFNKPDIAHFVRDRLERHALFKRDEDRDVLGANLIKQVVDHSNGVFLWVRLVIDDLEEGLTDRNTIVQLQKRLDRLPTELESFYDHMLDRIKEDYRQESATMLLTTYHAHDLLSPMAFWFISERAPELGTNHPTIPTNSRVNNKRRSVMDFRVRSYSRGLLVIQDLPLASPRVVALPSSSLFGQKVNFLHRTVREFLIKEHVIQRLDAWKPADFEVNELICKAIRAEIRGSPNDPGYFTPDGPIAGLIGIFAIHCRRLHTMPSHEAIAEVLQNSLEKVLSLHRKVNGHQIVVTPLVERNKSTRCSLETQQRPTEAGAPRELVVKKEKFSWKSLFR